MDLAHWEFVGLLFGLALALIEMSEWKMSSYLRHGIGIAGVLLSLACVVLLFGFSGAKLRSPVAFRWPVVLPTDKPATVSRPIAHSEPIPTPRTINSPELEAVKRENDRLKEENAKLKADKALLKKIKPRLVTVLPEPSPCSSLAQFLLPQSLVLTIVTPS
jgi:hypothetical protein